MKSFCALTAGLAMALTAACGGPVTTHVDPALAGEPAEESPERRAPGEGGDLLASDYLAAERGLADTPGETDPDPTHPGDEGADEDTAAPLPADKVVFSGLDPDRQGPAAPPAERSLPWES